MISLILRYSNINIIYLFRQELILILLYVYSTFKGQVHFIRYVYLLDFGRQNYIQYFINTVYSISSKWNIHQKCIEILLMFIQIFESTFWGKKNKYFLFIEWIKISRSDIAGYFHVMLENFWETTSGHTNLQFLVTRFCIHLETSWCTCSFTRYWVSRNNTRGIFILRTLWPIYIFHILAIYLTRYIVISRL